MRIAPVIAPKIKREHGGTKAVCGGKVNKYLCLCEFNLTVCFSSNLNGKYYNIPEPPKGERGICWNEFNGYGYSMKFVQMMIRPKRI